MQTAGSWQGGCLQLLDAWSVTAARVDSTDLISAVTATLQPWHIHLIGNIKSLDKGYIKVPLLWMEPNPTSNS